MFAALAGHVAAGHWLTILIGNHDIELTLPSVQAALLRIIEAHPHQVAFIDDGSAYLALGPENGISSGLPIHDLDFTADGELVVLHRRTPFQGIYPSWRIAARSRTQGGPYQTTPLPARPDPRSAGAVTIGSGIGVSASPT